MASGYVLDTSVVVRWFLDQVGYRHARDVLHDFVVDRVQLDTIDFARVELTEVLRRRGLNDGRMNKEEFVAGAKVIDDLGIAVYQVDAGRLVRAADLASAHSLRTYDALFVELARELQRPLLTADKKLCRAVEGLAEVVVLDGID